MQQQQPLFTAQGQQIPQPPAIISTKDLSYLTDMMSWNLNALKKAHFFASHCQIQEVAQTLEKACHMHQRHYNQILAHMEKHTQQAPQPPNQQQQQQQMQQNQMQ